MEDIAEYRDNKHKRTAFLKERILTLSKETLVELYKIDPVDASTNLMIELALNSRQDVVNSIIKLGWAPNDDFCNIILLLSNDLIEGCECGLFVYDHRRFVKMCVVINWLLTSKLITADQINGRYLTAIAESNRMAKEAKKPILFRIVS